MGAFLIFTQPVAAQSAAVSIIKSQSQGFQASNSTGFAFFSNGTFDYAGPLNELRVQSLSAGATLSYDGRRITVTTEDALIQSRMPMPTAKSNTLSSQLSEGEIHPNGTYQNVELGASLVVPAITRISGSHDLTRTEQVDSQSMSIFSGFSPSVFR